MSYLNPRDFMQEVAAGNTEYSRVNKYGYNGDVDSGAAEDIIEQGGSITYPTSAESLEIVSSAGADENSAGSGAKEITLEGLDANWAFQTATIDTNGTTAVAVSGTWLRVFRMYVSEAGSGGTNAGQITCRVASGGATRLIIAAGNGQTLFAGFTVPTGKTAYIWDVYASFAGTIPATDICAIKLWVKPELDASPFANGWRLAHRFTLNTDGDTYIHHLFPVPLSFTGPCDIRLEAAPDTDNTIVDGGFTVLYA